MVGRDADDGDVRDALFAQVVIELVFAGAPFEPGIRSFELAFLEDRIELAAFIYEGEYDMGIIFARQASLISATGQIAPKAI